MEYNEYNEYNEDFGKVDWNSVKKTENLIKIAYAFNMFLKDFKKSKEISNCLTLKSKLNFLKKMWELLPLDKKKYYIDKGQEDFIINKK